MFRLDRITGGLILGLSEESAVYPEKHCLWKLSPVTDDDDGESTQLYVPCIRSIDITLSFLHVLTHVIFATIQ